MFLTVTLQLLQGFAKTVELFALTLVFSLPLGLLLSLGSMSRIPVLKYPIKFIIWVIRGTPLMLQLMVIFYGPGLLGNPIWNSLGSNGRFMAALVAFVINYSCYFSEIYRGGIQSIPVGQYEAGKVLGMTNGQIFRKIILLQVIKRIVPPMSNEIITLVKDTSLANVISVTEIIFMGNSFTKTNGLIWPLFYTGAFYLAFCGILTILFSYIEKKLNYFR